MPSTTYHNDFAGRALAVFFILIGIGILLFVCTVAWHLFQSPVPGLDLTVKPALAPPPAANIGAALASFFKQIVLLFLMTLVGSLVASHGIRLYFGTSTTGAKSESSVPAEKSVPPAASTSAAKKPASADPTS